ncbi:MAG: glutathione synthase [Candidatus Omnitrophica bacterium]|nr:glutathione synthase [Candidatus Omnitrophota bacterium]
MKHNRKQRAHLQIAFIMDPMEKILLKWDTTLAIMIEAQNRGHHILYIEPRDLFARNDGVYAHVREIHASRKTGFRVLNRRTIDLKSCDVIFNRKDPPFDLSYLYLTHLLELLEPEVFVINSAKGLRKANEKLYTLEFPKWIPPTLVSNDPERIQSFRNQLKSDLIVKPLDQKGGAGIKLLLLKSRKANTILHRATRGGAKWIMAQKFLRKNLTSGDKRILILNGKMIGQFGRIPKRGEFRSNLSLGGKYIRVRLSETEKKLVDALRPKLLRDGLYFVGIDVVDGKLIEINVTSPAGITEINELEGTHPEIQVVDFLEHSSLRRGRRPTKQSRT